MDRDRALPGRTRTNSRGAGTCRSILVSGVIDPLQPFPRIVPVGTTLPEERTPVAGVAVFGGRYPFDTMRELARTMNSCTATAAPSKVK
jgi:hypothetical protein